MWNADVWRKQREELKKEKRKKAEIGALAWSLLVSYIYYANYICTYIYVLHVCMRTTCNYKHE